MGGIREKGFFVNCDRCSKDREVSDEKHIAMYKKFAGRKERSVLMFNSVLITPDGDKVSGFEWLCPECISAVSTYLGKAAPEKSASGDGSGGEQAPKRRGRQPKQSEAATEPVAQKTEAPAPPATPAPTEAADEPDRDASPGVETDGEEDDGGGVDDNELFD
jgi:hypothetical protein